MTTADPEPEYVTIKDEEAEAATPRPDTVGMDWEALGRAARNNKIVTPPEHPALQVGRIEDFK